MHGNKYGTVKKQSYKRIKKGDKSKTNRPRAAGETGETKNQGATRPGRQHDHHCRYYLCL